MDGKVCNVVYFIDKEALNLICEKCHKNLATMRYAEVIDGKVSELKLCADCFKKLQNEVSVGFEIAGSAPSPHRITERQAAALSKPLESDQCQVCGITLREVLETGHVGCAACYEHLREKLEVFLNEIHGSLKHCGKRQRLDDAREQLRVELRAKRALLQTALDTENYEEAAVLRDAIRELENALSGSLSDDLKEDVP